MFKKKINKKRGIVTNEAVVIENLSRNIYKVKLKNSKTPITGYLSGNMIINHIRLLKDDVVIVELSTSDPNRCRIVFRK